MREREIVVHVAPEAVTLPREAPPERRLALAVIAQALRDARIGNRDAERFLADGEMLRFWCAAADLDVGTLRRALDRRQIVAERVTAGDVASPAAFSLDLRGPVGVEKRVSAGLEARTGTLTRPREHARVQAAGILPDTLRACRP